MNFKKVWNILFCLSIMFNIVTLLGRVNYPDYTLGVLKKDLFITSYGSNESISLMLPKGLNVVNVSPKGLSAVGLFDPERFSFTIAASSSEFIDYSNLTKKSPY